jgi:hypothetical protein
MSFTDQFKELKTLEIEVDETNKVVVSLKESNKMKLLDIRKWYMADSGLWFPTSKGISLKIVPGEGNPKNILTQALTLLDEE